MAVSKVMKKDQDSNMAMRKLWKWYILYWYNRNSDILYL